MKTIDSELVNQFLREHKAESEARNRLEKTKAQIRKLIDKGYTSDELLIKADVTRQVIDWQAEYTALVAEYFEPSEAKALLRRINRKYKPKPVAASISPLPAVKARKEAA